MRRRLIAIGCLLVLSSPAHAQAFSVLAHEAMVDSAWDDVIAPLLQRRFPSATADQITHARAFAYGGSVMPDLGYFPFGSHLFTNLVHYVRSGDFVAALVRDASTVDEMAFALGAMAHYISDNTGHPGAVNRAVPLIYPQTRARFGSEVTYAEDPKRHVMVEFAFDVVQVAGGAYLPDAYRAFIGFDVAKPLLERAFRETYGLEVKDLFLNTDLAIGTFRWAVSQTIPEMTRVAWRDKEQEIRRVTPAVQRDAFIYGVTRREYEEAFGTSYRSPGWLARFLATLFKIVPKVGPFRPLAFRAPTPEAERLFAAAFRDARERYRRSLADARDGRVALPNTDFDTGRPAAWGEYPLADDTYRQLLDRLAKDGFAGVTPALRAELLRYFDRADDPGRTGIKRKDLARVRQQVAQLRAAG